VPIDIADFVRRWSQSNLREQQAAQAHFIELCHLVDHPTPTEADPKGEFFTFEEHVTKDTGRPGRADVWYKGRFAWEYKGKDRDLDAAYAQLLSYKSALDNPPLLVVCDFNEYRIYPQWTNMSGQPFVFTNADLLKPDGLKYLRWLFHNPGEFQRERENELDARRRLTEKLAGDFAALADMMRRYRGSRPALKDGAESTQPGALAPGAGVVWEPMQIARFLTKLVFTLFAEDIGLLPRIVDKPAFSYIVEEAQTNPRAFAPALRDLFRAMNGDTDQFFMKYVPYFNGGLFRDSAPGADDGTEVLDLTLLVQEGALIILDRVSRADWHEVNPSILGTLFERAIDESKRAQLGAHYTSEADIKLIVEPVLMQPLYRAWEAIRAEAAPLLQTYLNINAAPRERQQAADHLTRLHDQMLDRLENTRVLDPACGSGNFLYVSLRMMKDLEAEVRKLFAPLRLPFRDAVTPRQLYGIEKDEFAAKLAHISIWIGYLQWRYDHAGGVLKAVARPATSPQDLTTPILKDQSNGETSRILCDDAILRYDTSGKPYEPEWPVVDVIVSNPPFLGGKRMRSELDDHYVDQLFNVYEGRVPHEADLVTYWFEKARAKIEQGSAKRAGLLATNSIRGGVNRVVLDRIKQTGDIFMAWGDRPWVLAGAAVRISVVGFDDGTQKEYILDGAPVHHINADLQNTIDATKAHTLPENKNVAFMGDTKNGSFDIPGELASEMLKASNNSGRSNSAVVRPWVNGLDITRRSRGMWIIDFGSDMSLEDAKLYEMPFQYIQRIVYPERIRSRTARAREVWWRHEAPRPEMRKALVGLKRFVVTPNLAKYRLFNWLLADTLADHQLIVFARDDDYFFGALHAYPHEIWSLRLGTSLEDRPRYTPTTTFETFPFPWSPGQEPTADPAYQAISAAARQLHAEREGWLNPPDLVNDVGAGFKPAPTGASARSAALKDRTLTNLYNALDDYREHLRQGEPYKTDDRKPATRFAPRLYELHAALDAAVLRAYGWDDLIDRLRTSEGDEELLRRLLALNLARAGV